MGMYKGRLLGDQHPEPRVHLVRCADGERVDITDALAAERQRLTAAARERETEAKRAERREVMRGWTFLFICVAVIGGAAGMIAAAVMP